jgi:hypothetical protein
MPRPLPHYRPSFPEDFFAEATRLAAIWLPWATIGPFGQENEGDAVEERLVVFAAEGIGCVEEVDGGLESLRECLRIELELALRQRSEEAVEGPEVEVEHLHTPAGQLPLDEPLEHGRAKRRGGRGVEWRDNDECGLPPEPCECLSVKGSV